MMTVEFFNTLGIIGAMMILFYCLVQVFDPRIREGVLGCMLYLSISTCCLAALIHMLQGTHPPITINTMMALIGVLMLRRMLLSTPQWVRFKAWYFLKAKEAKAHNRSK